jgi:trimeric autotransporter adhesin
LAGCGNVPTTSDGSGADSSTLVSISLTPPNPTFAKNTDLQFVATGTYSNNKTRNLTESVTWSSSDETLVAIDKPGHAYGKGSGKTTIKASLGDVSGETTVTVSPATLVSIALTPTNPAIAKGTTQPITATGTFSDSTTQDLTASVTWSSSNSGAATISNTAGSQGLASSVATGSTTITATSGGISGTTTLTVTPAILKSIAITPTNPSVANGTSRQFTATGTFSDNTTQDLTASVSWNSSNTGAATISNTAGSQGLAASAATGSTTITATLGSIAGSTTLTVTPATLVSIAITPTNPNIAKGTGKQFTATGTYSDGTTQNLTTTATWNSSSSGIATISNAAGSQGLATSAATGSTTITATLGSISGSTTLTVTPATLVSIAITPTNPSIAKGTGKQFTATGTYSDGTTQNLTTTATWSSSSSGIATISNAAGSQGLATSVAAGSTTIKATSAGISGSTTLTVTQAVLVSIAITPSSQTISAGTTKQFTATGTYSDGTTQNLTTTATWSSSSSGIATISNAAGSQGLATAVAAGTTTIMAVSGSISSTAALTVTGNNTVTLTWDAPTTRSDGSPLNLLTDLSGYTIHYGTLSQSYTQTIAVANPGTAVVTRTFSLTPGTYYFAVTAIDSSGQESPYSSEASKTL